MRTALLRRVGHVHCALEAIYHRHNVSAILRTCDAVGLFHVHLVQGHFRAARGAARGAERWLDLHHHASPEAAIGALRDAGVDLWVADLSPDGVAPEEVPLDRPICLWVGAELEGVNPLARAAARGVVTLPMMGLAQSLNVSVAAALCLRPLADRARSLGDTALLPPEEREAVWAEWMAREQAAGRGRASRANLRLDTP